ncbi:hypothetical protein [Nannocystis punicea]|uniref:Peptidase M23 domain-containing protein n=1 Tax=Nannocystis punicea TaxID=2995304 RepID=A0ABY7GWU0_9BACT|nr:hypothetical protein [Nannocystis poenicansa]WAS91455.1 hypothetical protein O0S08_35175 [Nannocystis poenicansa]
MPWRGDSLDLANTYFRGKGHSGWNAGVGNPLDLGAVRWDSTIGANGKWTTSRTTGQDGNTTPQDDVVFGAKVYSPVDGFVVGCQKEVDDNGNASGSIVSGNHVNILTSDGRMILLAHLRDNTIPPGVCPNTVDLVTTSGANCVPNVSGSKRLPVDTILTTPVEIHKGDFVGEVGFSGNTSNPHFHIQVKSVTTDSQGELCLGDDEVIEFDESWRQATADLTPLTDSWTAFAGNAGVFDNTQEYLLLSDPLGARVDTLDIEEGTIPAIVMTNPSTSGGVVAYKNASNNFTAMGFVFDANGDFDLGTPDVKGSVSDIALAKISTSSRHVVAAVRNGSNNLQIIPYFVETDGDLIEGTGETRSGIGFVEATRSPSHDGVVVAFKNSSNTLSVYDYEATVSGTNVAVDLLGNDVSSDTISDVGVAAVTAGRGNAETTGAFKGVVTVERRTDNSMWVRTWAISAAGVVDDIDVEQAKDASNTAISVAEVDVAVVGDTSREFAVVSARTQAGNLVVQTWEIATTGALTRLEHASPGAIGALGSAKVGTQDALTAVADSGGNLSLISWSVSPKVGSTAGGLLRRVGTRLFGGISAVAMDGRPATDEAVIVVRNSSNDISLLHHRTNYSAAR